MKNEKIQISGKPLEELYAEFNREIVLLFLKKLELLTPEERKTILKTIQFINSPMFVI